MRADDQHLRRRLTSAIEDVERLRNSAAAMHHTAEFSRLDGKVDGLKLALSYLNESDEPLPHLWGPVVAAMSLTDEQLVAESERRGGYTTDPTQAALLGSSVQVPE